MNSLENPTRSSIRSQVRVALTREERLAVARLRYEVYVEEMRRCQDHADHAARTVSEPLDDEGIVIAACAPDGRAIGTLRLNSATASQISCREMYGWEEREHCFPGQIVLASKLIVAPEHRGTVLSLEIIRVAVREVLRRGWRFVFLDANAHLVALYTRLGFVARACTEHPLYGSVTVMEWDLHDLEHMRRIRSPLLKTVIAQLTALGVAA